MKLAPPPLVVTPNEGFEKTDLFEYKDFGERFAHIVEALDSATVMGARWALGQRQDHVHATRLVESSPPRPYGASSYSPT